ncbi:hypothetical protein ZWY2020_014731 [Hordeum vulgare]|nr:hypothetical protein ZWY2020_014731 [Hordeum vulgare]
MDHPITGWDEKRTRWLRADPELADGGEGSILMVSGLQSVPCRSLTWNSASRCTGTVAQPRRQWLAAQSPSWTGLNVGVFVVRTCQWSLDFMDVWAAMGPDLPGYERWGAVLTFT